jgi:hypothetical protein
MLVFAVVGVSALVVAYALGLGGTVGALIMGAIIGVGATLEVAQPLLDKLRP